ncbi:tetratricopeptide repeat protein [Microcoleus sp. SVA1_A1]|uniref:tetratricopeptide repeat protein n=1 Tax=Microcoleus sp. SVA1_A1 TaxID=2818946 RepID=UPI002FD2C0F4
MINDRINSVRLLSVLVEILFITPSSLVTPVIPVSPVMTQGSPNSQESDPQKLYEEGEVFFQQGTEESLPQALEKYQQALTLFRAAGNRLKEADVLSNIGVVYDWMEQPQQALSSYEQSLTVYRTHLGSSLKLL